MSKPIPKSLRPLPIRKLTPGLEPEPATPREQLFRDLMVLAVQLESILVSDVIPMMRATGHPLTGRVSSLRSEIKLRASLIGSSK